MTTNTRSTGNIFRRNILPKLSVRQRLIFSYAILVLSVIVVGVAALISTAMKGAALEELIEAKEEAFLVKQLQIALLEARREEKNFLLFNQAEGFETAFKNYVTLNRTHTVHMLEFVDEGIAANTGSGEREVQHRADLEQIKVDIEEYIETFQALVENIHSRGDEESGNLGLIIANLDDINAQLEAVGEAEVSGFKALEQFLKYVKNGRQEHVDGFRTAMSALTAVLEAEEAFSEAEKQALLTEAEEASASFEDLLLIDAAIAEKEAIMVANTDNIGRLGVELVASEFAIEEEALTTYRNTDQLANIIDITLLIVATVVGVFLSNRIINSILTPLGSLSAVSQAVADGDLKAKAPVTSDDELGALATQFNAMVAQLNDTLEGLEQRITARTQALENSMEISRHISTILDEEQLVQELADQLHDILNYYYAHIFLLDPEKETLVMIGGTGEIGQQIRASNLRIPIGRGLVGRAAATNILVLVEDVYKDADWLPNPLLPETRTEVAIPIAIGDNVLGVLDVQHNAPGSIRPADIDMLRSLTNQVAVALQNARSYATAQQRATRETLINTIGQHIQGTTSIHDALQIAVREVGRALGTSHTAVRLSIKDENGQSE